MGSVRANTPRMNPQGRGCAGRRSEAMPGATQTTSMSLLCFGFDRKKPAEPPRGAFPPSETPGKGCQGLPRLPLQFKGPQGLCLPLSTPSWMCRQIPPFTRSALLPKAPRNPRSHGKSQLEPSFGGATEEEARDKVTFKNKRQIATTEGRN